MVEMITVELVQANTTRGVLVSLLCQSKNSEVLNTFHPSSGGGAHNAIRKSVEKTLGVSIPQAGYTAGPRVSRDAIVRPAGQEDRGWRL